MSKTLKIFNQRIVQKGVFDLKSMYDKVKSWFDENDYEFSEKDSTTKIKPHGTDITIRFTASRIVDYLAKYEIKIEFFLLNSEKTAYKGKKLDKGELEIRINGNLIIDYKHKYSSKLMSFLLDFYLKNIIVDRLENYYSGQVYTDSFTIFNMLKGEMDLIS